MKINKRKIKENADMNVGKGEPLYTAGRDVSLAHVLHIMLDSFTGFCKYLIHFCFDSVYVCYVCVYAHVNR